MKGSSDSTPLARKDILTLGYRQKTKNAENMQRGGSIKNEKDENKIERKIDTIVDAGKTMSRRQNKNIEQYP